MGDIARVYISNAVILCVPRITYRGNGDLCCGIGEISLGDEQNIQFRVLGTEQEVLDLLGRMCIGDRVHIAGRLRGRWMRQFSCWARDVHILS